MKLKRILIPALAATSLFVFASCGDDDEVGTIKKNTEKETNEVYESILELQENYDSQALKTKIASLKNISLAANANVDFGFKSNSSYEDSYTTYDDDGKEVSVKEKYTYNQNISAKVNSNVKLTIDAEKNVSQLSANTSAKVENNRTQKMYINGKEEQSRETKDSTNAEIKDLLLTVQDDGLYVKGSINKSDKEADAIKFNNFASDKDLTDMATTLMQSIEQGADYSQAGYSNTMVGMFATALYTIANFDISTYVQKITNFDTTKYDAKINTDLSELEGTIKDYINEFHVKVSANDENEITYTATLGLVEVARFMSPEGFDVEAQKEDFYDHYDYIMDDYDISADDFEEMANEYAEKQVSIAEKEYKRYIKKGFNTPVKLSVTINKSFYLPTAITFDGDALAKKIDGVSLNQTSTYDYFDDENKKMVYVDEDETKLTFSGKKLNASIALDLDAEPLTVIEGTEKESYNLGMTDLVIKIMSLAAPSDDDSDETEGKLN